LIFDITLDEGRKGGRLEASKNTFTLTPNQLTYLKRQELYINLHSENNRSGEIRGQIAPLGAAYFVGNLEGAQEVPAINVPSNGRALVTFDGNNTIYVSGTFNDLQGDLNTALAGGAHLHLAARGANGPILFPLDVTLADDKRNGVFLPQNNKFVLTRDQRDALFTEGVYVNVHSLVHAPGELRGQLVGQTIPECGNPVLVDVTCPTPNNLTTKSIDSRRTRVDWDKVSGAARYKIEIRFAGQTKIVGRGLVRGNGIFVFAPSGRDYEIRIQTICRDGSESLYTAWVPFSTPASFRSGVAEGRSSNNTDGLEAIEILNEQITDIAVYPNPILDVLNVAYATSTNTGVLTVFHVSGQRVNVTQLSENQDYHQVNLSDLPDGAYILTIEEEGKLPHTERIIKGSR